MRHRSTARSVFTILMHVCAARRWCGTLAVDTVEQDDCESKTSRAGTLISTRDFAAFPSQVASGVVVYLETFTLLDDRIVDTLAAYTQPFVLMTGQRDCSVPGEEIAEVRVRRILRLEKLSAWFCQNWAAAPHPKVVVLPLAINFHSLSELSEDELLLRPSRDWGPRRTPDEQERELREVMRVPFAQREPRAYINFIQSFDETPYPDRNQALEGIPAELQAREIDYVERAVTWANQAAYQFVVSPHGNGLDCHRTWEALALGCIPIVRRSTLSDAGLYDGLPVLVVNEWTDVTPALLSSAAARFGEMASRSLELPRLQISYWHELVTSKLTGAHERRRAMAQDGDLLEIEIERDTVLGTARTRQGPGDDMIRIEFRPDDDADDLARRLVETLGIHTVTPDICIQNASCVAHALAGVLREKSRAHKEDEEKEERRRRRRRQQQQQQQQQLGVPQPHVDFAPFAHCRRLILSTPHCRGSLDGGVKVTPHVDVTSCEPGGGCEWPLGRSNAGACAWPDGARLCFSFGAAHEAHTKAGCWELPLCRHPAQGGCGLPEVQLGNLGEHTVSIMAWVEQANGNRMLTQVSTLQFSCDDQLRQPSAAAPATATVVVVVQLYGGLANNLLQYIAGRILATKLGADLQLPPSASAITACFPQVQSTRATTRALVAATEADGASRGGRRVERDTTMIVGDSDAPKRCVLAGFDLSGQCMSFDQALLELASRQALPGRISLEGHFEDYDLLQPWKDQIRTWLDPSEDTRKEAVAAIGGEQVAIAVHIRVCEANVTPRDRAKGGLHGTANWPALPIDYYSEIVRQELDALRATGAELLAAPVVVVVAPPECVASPEARALVDQFEAVLYGGDQFGAFETIRRATHAVVLSSGTFGWLAAWLGNARSVHMPLVGLRCRNHLKSRMIPWDEPLRWVFHDPKTSESHGRIVGERVVFSAMGAWKGERPG